MNRSFNLDEVILWIDAFLDIELLEKRDGCLCCRLSKCTIRINCKSNRRYSTFVLCVLLSSDKTITDCSVLFGHCLNYTLPIPCSRSVMCWPPARRAKCPRPGHISSFCPPVSQPATLAFLPFVPDRCFR